MLDIFGFERSGAILSPCGRYRYSLTRRWDPDREMVAFIMLNPSTADARHDDPTIRRCIRYAQSWGFGSLVVGNLFALRATDPRELRRAEDPVGPENDHHLVGIAIQAKLVVAAWGNDGDYLGRDDAARRLFPDLHVLKVTKEGQPGHPLYLRSDLKPIPWARPMPRGLEICP